MTRTLPPTNTHQGRVLLFFSTRCRELLLNNNLLRVLPNEIGKLFKLSILGLHGNPLGKEVLSIYNELNGTSKLLTFMLDNINCKSSDASAEAHPDTRHFNRLLVCFSVVNAPPPQRPWIPLARPNRSRPACKFTKWFTSAQTITQWDRGCLISAFRYIYSNVL